MRKLKLFFSAQKKNTSGEQPEQPITTATDHLVNQERHRVLTERLSAINKDELTPRRKRIVENSLRLLYLHKTNTSVKGQDPAAPSMGTKVGTGQPALRIPSNQNI